MTNYKLLNQYDNFNEGAHNWIHIKNNVNNLMGIAMSVPSSSSNQVVVFIGKDEENLDAIISIDDFNNNYTITDITDHWGKTIHGGIL